MAAVPTRGRGRRQQALPSAHTRPLRVFSRDERRGGLLTVRRRRLTARGGQPVGPGQPVFEGFDVYGAVAPAPGERCFLELPSLNAAPVHMVIDVFAEAFPDRRNLLRLDHRGAHTAQRRTLPANVGLVCWPPYGPELNPLARVWRDLKEALAWRHFPTPEVQQDDGAPLLRGYEAATLQALTGYPYLVEAIHALRLSRSDINGSRMAAMSDRTVKTALVITCSRNAPYTVCY